jgi:glutaredoxin
MDAGHPPLELILYSRAGCHLCDEARAILQGLLGQRRAAGLIAPDLVERDITTDPSWEREFLTTIPVVELGDRRLELVTSAAKLKALLATLDERPVSIASA